MDRPPVSRAEEMSHAGAAVGGAYASLFSVRGHDSGTSLRQFRSQVIDEGADAQRSVSRRRIGHREEHFGRMPFGTNFDQAAIVEIILDRPIGQDRITHALPPRLRRSAQASAS